MLRLAPVVLGLVLIGGAVWLFFGRGGRPDMQPPAPDARTGAPAAPGGGPPDGPAPPTTLDSWAGAAPCLTMETVVRLPDVVGQIVPGADGRVLVLHYPRLRRLDVFDTAAARVVRSVELAEERARVAVGMTKILVHLPASGLVQRYDLATGRRELSAPFPVRHVTAFALGHASTGPLLVGGERGVRLYDVATLREIELPEDPDDRPPEERRLVPGFRREPGERTLPFGNANGRFRAAPNGRVFVAHEITREPEAVAVAPDRVVRAELNRDGTWAVQPGPGGRSDPFADLKPVPALHGPFHLQAVGDSVLVYRHGATEPVAVVKHAPAVVEEYPPWVSETAQPSWLNLVPKAGVLVLLDGGGDRLRVVPLDLDGSVAKAGADLFVTSAPPAEFRPGERLRYSVRAVSKAGGVTFALKSGPDGMVVDRDGVVTWTPPPGFGKPASAVVILTDASGKLADHAFTVVPEGAAEFARLPAQSPVGSPAGPLRPPPPSPLPIKPPQLAGRTVVRLPAGVARVMPAGGGRFLVLHFPTLKQVGVFDVTEARLVRTIDVPDDKPLLAAGMTKLVVYLPATGDFKRHDLTTGKPDGGKKLGVASVRAIALGHASAGPLLVTNADGGRLFDLDSLDELTIPPGENPDFDGRPPNRPRLLPLPDFGVSAAGNGRVFVGSRVVSVQGGRVVVSSHPGPAYTFGPARPSPNGRYVFGQPGPVSTDGQPAPDVVLVDATDVGAVPATDGPYYLHPEPTVLTVRRYGLSAPVARLVDLADWGKKPSAFDGKPSLPDADRFHLIPRANLAVVVSPAADRLLLAPIDLGRAEDALGDELGTDLLLVTSSPPATFCPGTEFRYQLRARSRQGGVRFELIAGPAGMTVGADGLVRWKVPAATRVALRVPVGFGSFGGRTITARLPFDLVPGEVVAIVGLTDAAGKEAVQRFRLDRADRPEEFTPDPAPAALAPHVPAPPTTGPRTVYRLPAAPAPPDVSLASLAGRAEITVPGTIDAVIPAGAGRFLVLHVKSARKALVFDACAAAVTREIDVADPDAVLAAGAIHLLVYRRADGTLEKYDLLTGTGGGRKPFPTRDVTELVMGSASAGPVFVRAGMRAELYDAETLTPLDLPRVVPGGADTFPFRQGRVWASPDGRVFGNVADRPTGPVASVAHLWPEGIDVVSSVLPRPPAYLLPDDVSRRRLYVGGYGGTLYTTDLAGRPKLQPVAPHQFGQSGDPLLPAHSAPYYLTVHPARLPREPNPNEVPPKNGVSIYRQDQAARVAVVEAPEITADTGRGLGVEGAVHLFPFAGLLAVVPPAADRLVLYPANLGPGADLDRPALRWRLPEVPAAPVVKPTLLRERKAINMGPYALGRIAAGGGGRYLVCQEGGALRIVDVVEGKVVGTVPGNRTFAVGMSKLVVLDHGLPRWTLKRYDLATGKLEASAAIADVPMVLAMGSASAGPVAAIGLEGLTFYDLATLQPLWPPGEPGKCKLDPQRLAASADGRTFVTQRWFSSTEWGPVVVTLENDGVRYTARPGPRVVSSVAAGPDGRYVFLGGVGVLAGDLRVAEGVAYSPKELGAKHEPGLTFVPAVDGPYYLHVHIGKRSPDPRFAADPEFGVTVYRYGDATPKGHLPGAFGPLPKRVGKIPWEIERGDPGEVAFLFSAAKVLVTVNPARTGLLLTPLDPEAIPATTDPPNQAPKTIPPKPKRP